MTKDNKSKIVYHTTTQATDNIIIPYENGVYKI